MLGSENGTCTVGVAPAQVCRLRKCRPPIVGFVSDGRIQCPSQAPTAEEEEIAEMKQTESNTRMLAVGAVVVFSLVFLCIAGMATAGFIIHCTKRHQRQRQPTRRISMPLLNLGSGVYGETVDM